MIKQKLIAVVNLISVFCVRFKFKQLKVIIFIRGYNNGFANKKAAVSNLFVEFLRAVGLIVFYIASLIQFTG